MQLKTCPSAIDDLNPTQVINLFDNNSALVKSIGNDEKSTLYPPPSTEILERIVYSPRADRFISLLSDNTICVYRRFKATCLLEKII